jgi:hypothetical protein
VTDAPPLHGTLPQPTGSLVKLLPARISGSNSFYIHLTKKKLKKLEVFFWRASFLTWGCLLGDVKVKVGL